MSGVRAFQAPMPWLRTQRWTQGKEKWGLSWADLLRDCPSIWVPLCFPNSHLPLKATNVPTPLPSPTELPTDPVPVTEWGDWRAPGEGGECPLIPQPHLLMEIVVKQDQVEVPLQALKRPLLDTVLAAASLGGKDREGPAVKMGQFRPTPSLEVKPQKSLEGNLSCPS